MIPSIHIDLPRISQAPAACHPPYTGDSFFPRFQGPERQPEQLHFPFSAAGAAFPGCAGDPS